jgi:hypothetical protein
MKQFIRKHAKLVAPTVGALIVAAAVALAANTTFVTNIGDIVFPFSPPNQSAGTPGTIDNMTIGATTPQPGTFTNATVNNTLTAAQVNSMIGSYAKNPASSTYYPSYQFANNQSQLLFSGNGTTSYTYVTLAPNPIDGWEACFFSQGAITTLYVYGSPGQTVVNAATSMSANSKQCYKYSLSNTTWTRSQ